MTTGSERGANRVVAGPAVASTALPRVAVEALEADAYVAAIPELAALLVDAVEGGASVNFLAGLTLDQAAAWWTARIPHVRDGTTTLFVARALPGPGEAGGTREATAPLTPAPSLVGSTLLIRTPNPNAPHRAEIAKVLVHRSVRRLGVGRALMDAAEALARAEGRWLLLLDTQTGSGADDFYRSLGWTELGTMPNHSLRTDGVLAPTTFFWKDLRA